MSDYLPLLETETREFSLLESRRTVSGTERHRPRDGQEQPLIVASVLHPLVHPLIIVK